MISSDYAIKSYVSICNRALILNKDRFPFKQILGAANFSESHKKIEVKIAGADVVDSYVFSIEEGQIVVMRHSTCGQCQCVRQWHLEWRYLEQVLKNPEIYIQNPARINWEWMFDIKN